MLPDEIKECGLQLFKYEFQRAMQEFLIAIKEERTPATVIARYIKRTKEDVRNYDGKDTYDKASLSQLFEAVRNYHALQEKQIFEEIVETIKQIIDEKKETYDIDKNLINNLEEFCAELQYIKKPEEKGRKLFELWEPLEKEITDFVLREDLKGLLKHYHNLYNAYKDFEKMWKPEKMVREIRYHNIFKAMYTALYKKLLEMLEEFEKERNQQLDWEAIQLEGEHLEHLKRRIRSEKEEGIKKRLKHILSKYPSENL